MRHPRALHRTELLLGSDGLDRLAAARVILFGVGGVGSWCAEALLRTGVGHLTLVDSDLICVTNVNRQVQATAGNVGQVKVFALRDRLVEIRPDADVLALQRSWDRDTRDRDTWDLDTRDGFDLGAYDYVVDAIDSLNNKVELIRAAHAAGARLFSAMGAASKLDPTRIGVASIWDTEMCPLARLVRGRLRRRGFDGDFLCVFSDEPVRNVQTDGPDEGCSTEARINGSLAHMTATFGMILAGLVIQDLVSLIPIVPRSF
jgi:tRNA A37 threonylcarbamoyladenosine dehydratase